MEVPSLVQLCSISACGNQYREKLPTALIAVVEANSVVVGSVNMKRIIHMASSDARKCWCVAPRLEWGADSAGQRNSMQYPRGVACSPTTLYVVLGFYSLGQAVAVYRLADGKYLGEYPKYAATQPRDHFATQDFVAVDRKNRVYVTDGSKIRIFGGNTLQPIRTIVEEIGLERVGTSPRWSGIAVRMNELVLTIRQAENIFHCGLDADVVEVAFPTPEHEKVVDREYSGNDREGGCCVLPNLGIAACNTKCNCVDVWARDNTYLYSIDGSLEGIKFPCDVACDASGHLFICWFNENCVTVHDVHDGKLLHKISGWISAEGEHVNFSMPCGVCISHQGELIVAERGSNRVTLF